MQSRQRSARTVAFTPGPGGTFMRDILLAIGRIALAAIFIMSGFGKVLALSDTAAYIASKGVPLPLVAAVVAAFCELGFGLLIAVGFRTKLAAAALVVFTIAATVMFHDFWTMTGADREMNQIEALKNLAMVGGFLMLIAVGAGRLSLDRGDTSWFGRSRIRPQLEQV
jgi:putative oxidoreductase